MNQNEPKAFIHHFNTTTRRLAIGLLFVILAPVAYAGGYLLFALVICM